jgi:hypothetical protein
MTITLRSPRTCLTLLAVVALGPSLASAQAGWERVQQLHPNQIVTLHLRNGEVLKGKMQSAAANSLSVVAKGQKPIQAGKEDIERVTRKSRLRGAMWGGIIGFAIGAPIGAFAGPYLADWGNPSASVRLRHGAGWGLFFGGIGAGVAALTGMETTVYRAIRR